MNSWKQDCSDLMIDQDLDAIFNPDSYFQVDEVCPNFLDVSEDSSNPSPFGDRLSREILTWSGLFGAGLERAVLGIDFRTQNDMAKKL